MEEFDFIKNMLKQGGSILSTPNAGSGDLGRHQPENYNQSQPSTIDITMKKKIAEGKETPQEEIDEAKKEVNIIAQITGQNLDEDVSRGDPNRDDPGRAIRHGYDPKGPRRWKWDPPAPREQPEVPTGSKIIAAMKDAARKSRGGYPIIPSAVPGMMPRQMEPRDVEHIGKMSGEPKLATKLSPKLSKERLMGLVAARVKEKIVPRPGENIKDTIKPDFKLKNKSEPYRPGGPGQRSDDPRSTESQQSSKRSERARSQRAKGRNR